MNWKIVCMLVVVTIGVTSGLFAGPINARYTSANYLAGSVVSVTVQNDNGTELIVVTLNDASSEIYVGTGQAILQPSTISLVTLAIDPSLTYYKDLFSLAVALQSTGQVALFGLMPGAASIEDYNIIRFITPIGGLMKVPAGATSTQ